MIYFTILYSGMYSCNVCWVEYIMLLGKSGKYISIINNNNYNNSNNHNNDNK